MPVARLESVDRALQLILLLRDGEPISVTTAADHLGVVPSTAHRLLGALCHRGFAVQTRDRLYRAGPELIATVGGEIQQATLRRAARPALEWLTDTVGETAQLMVLKGQNIEFIDGAEAGGVLRVAARIGDQMPAYCSAGGKALLAEVGDDEVDTIYHNGLPPWRTARITDLDALKTHLANVRKAGYGVNIDETESGVCGIGVCVRDGKHRPIAALTIALPSTRFDRNDLRRYVDSLRSAAHTVEDNLS